MLRVILFDILLFTACGYGLLRGKQEERLIAIVCILANFASYALVGPVKLSYLRVESGVLIVDLIALAVFTYVALRSDRFWPLWVSGLQLTTSIGHLLKVIEPDLLPLAYAAALRFWSYPILIILALGTWRGHRRRTKGTGDPAEEPAPA